MHEQTGVPGSKKTAAPPARACRAVAATSAAGSSSNTQPLSSSACVSASI